MSEFGTEITSADIIDTLGFFDGWEDRYKYIIDLGKELPPLDDSYKIEQYLVRGCQSQVWLVSEQRGDTLYFAADSDAFIVKGLLAVVLAAYNGKTPAEIEAFDIAAYFDDLNLLNHLSATRGNGLKSMVQRIQRIAQEAR
ncbi:SufE family protein [uncultured Gilvimarinus sp.]|jgi:cysteine desulfuration protein SufE|uniref:SufE family protein n=1 Tax=uncultured Gilvimarinus sp. TaxID=1689143 RepID=UPI0030D8DCE5